MPKLLWWVDGKNRAPDSLTAIANRIESNQKLLDDEIKEIFRCLQAVDAEIKEIVRVLLKPGSS